MIYTYLWVSSDKQSVDNQRYDILKYAASKKLIIDEWIEETVSGTRKVGQRKLGASLNKMQSADLLIVSELSHLGRNLMEVMSILHTCMEKEVKVFMVKEKYELGNNINSKVLAFAFSMSADIERQLISQRSREAMARKKSEGKNLAVPKKVYPKKPNFPERRGRSGNCFPKK